jgi:hypothetical protein
MDRPRITFPVLEAGDVRFHLLLLPGLVEPHW